MFQVLVIVKVCGPVQMSHLPDGVGGITGAILVTDEAIEAWRTESFLTIRAFKPGFAKAGSSDVVTLGTILALALVVTLWTVCAHRTVFLTSEGKL